jgi:hypothetical protein
MRRIEPTLSEELSRHFQPEKIASAPPYKVENYRRLAELVAGLSYANRDNLLFFRGQGQDFKSKSGASTFYPSIYRGDYLPHRELQHRFNVLDQASRSLAELFRQNKVTGHNELIRKKYIRWSILQHYGVCATPLLDLTQSLRVACSFASTDSDEGFVYVFGLPYLNGRISVNSEHDIVNVRLLSICPPYALRPYFQEGYLAGTEEITIDFEQKTELDFRNRLIAKFVFPSSKRFWGESFEPIPYSALFPDNDQIEELCRNVQLEVERELQPGEFGDFLSKWVELEDNIIQRSQRLTDRPLSMARALDLLRRKEQLNSKTVAQLEALRKFRNQLVHKPKVISPNVLTDHFITMERLLRELKPGEDGNN